MKTLILLSGLLLFASCSNDSLDCGVVSAKKINYDNHDMPESYQLTVDKKTFQVSKSVYDSYRPSDTYCF